MLAGHAVGTHLPVRGRQVFEAVNRGIFSQHKAVFSFMLCAAILRKAGAVANDEWQVLASGISRGTPRGTIEMNARDA